MKYILIALIIITSGCANMGNGLRAAAHSWNTDNSQTTSVDTTDPTKYQTKFVTKEGVVVGHQYGDRVVYADGSSGYIR
jgi:hypothetical protein